jgi:hypothetical protein
MARIAAMPGGQRPVLFEGQMRLDFVREGPLVAGIGEARVILVDCDDATRTRRLVIDRAQPELATATMMTWAAFLRREAEEGGYDVLDTSQRSLKCCVARICVELVPAGRG